jgi:hypothetical protein
MTTSIGQLFAPVRASGEEPPSGLKTLGAGVAWLGSGSGGESGDLSARPKGADTAARSSAAPAMTCPQLKHRSASAGFGSLQHWQVRIAPHSVGVAPCGGSGTTTVSPKGLAAARGGIELLATAAMRLLWPRIGLPHSGQKLSFVETRFPHCGQWLGAASVG